MSDRVCWIGLAGSAGSGKTTAARYLEQQWGMACFAFAEPVKRVAMLLHPEWSDEQVHGRAKDVADVRGLSPRAVFQEIGSAGRRLSPDYWLWAAERTLAGWRVEQEGLGERARGVVWTDVRYGNEARWVRRHGGVVVRIERRAAGGVREHESERPVADADHVIVNDGSLELLHAHLDGLVLGLGPVADLGGCRG